MNLFRWYRLMRTIWRTDNLREQMERVWADSGRSEEKPEVRAEPEEVREVPRKRTPRAKQEAPGRHAAATREPTDEEIRDLFGY